MIKVKVLGLNIHSEDLLRARMRVDNFALSEVQYAPCEEKEKTKLKPNKACVLLPAQDLIAQSLVSSSK